MLYTTISFILSGSLQRKSIHNNHFYLTRTTYRHKKVSAHNVCTMWDLFVKAEGHYIFIRTHRYELSSAIINIDCVIIGVGHSFKYEVQYSRKSWHLHNKYEFLAIINNTALIARFMGPAWGPPGDDRTQVGPCWPHEPCYLSLLQL